MLPNYVRDEPAVPAPRARRMRLVQDGDAPAVSPALAMQQHLVISGQVPLERYERYPLPFRVGFPVAISIALWALIIHAF